MTGAAARTSHEQVELSPVSISSGADSVRDTSDRGTAARG